MAVHCCTHCVIHERRIHQNIHQVGIAVRLLAIVVCVINPLCISRYKSKSLASSPVVVC